MNKDGKEELAKNPAGCQQLAALLKGLVDPSIVEEYYARSADLPARLLMCLRYSPKVAHLEALLRRPKQKQSPLKSLADELWDTGLQTEKERATTSLLNLCAAARHDLRDAPLIPHRLHFMLRPPDMATVRFPLRLRPAIRLVPLAGLVMQELIQLWPLLELLGPSGYRISS